VALAVIFTLAPATRWGYFVYPIGLVGWLVLTRPPATGPAPSLEIPAQAAEEQSVAVPAI
jgi:hypothetical protein